MWPAASPWIGQFVLSGICVKYCDWLTPTVWVFDISRKRWLFFCFFPSTFYLICGSLCFLSVSFPVKQIHQPLNKQQLCGNDQTLAGGSQTLFTLTSVFFFWWDFCLTCQLRGFILTAPFTIFHIGRCGLLSTPMCDKCDCNCRHWFWLTPALKPSKHTAGNWPAERI